MKSELIITHDDSIETTPYNTEFQTGYFEILQIEDGLYENEVTIGDLVYAVVGKKTISIVYPKSTSTYDLHDDDDVTKFRQHFAYIKDGHILRQNQINRLLEEIEETNVKYHSIGDKLLSFNPHVENGELSSTNLIPSSSGSMTVAKKIIAETRNDISRIQKIIQVKTDKLEVMLSEQTRALQLKTKELKSMLEVAEEAIWTVNLYLGKNEEIHVLKTGELAPPESKIKMRQKVLFMDEECSALTDDEGIDIDKLQIFDDWLLEDPKNLQRVLPDDKGIIALHTKRYKKKYEDPWVSSNKNEANLRWTYFLIRNGENLYRVFVDITLGKDLFPPSDELLDTFRDKHGEPLKPGTSAYMKALEESENEHRHNLRIMLILQGLLDRTKIFQPLPKRINVCDYNSCNDYIDFIYDNENLITSGRENFDTWLKNINQNIEIGVRIIGNFTYKLKGNKKDYDPNRIVPNNAALPESLILHNITKQEKREYGDRFYFLYNRTDKIYAKNWRYYEEHEPKVRASCWITKKDEFILNFDAVTLEELEYYYDSRNSRHLYQSMMPLLEVAINLKKQEILDEAPFRDLLINKLMARYVVNEEIATKSVDDLIKWWKFKTRVHRSLTIDDQKAYTMIMDEFGLRREKEIAREQAIGFEPILINSINGINETIMIAHRRANEYAAYIPHNDCNVWVKEQIWTMQRDGTNRTVRLKSEKLWQTVDKRHERWNIVYKTERWDSWKINPLKSAILTDPEISQLLNEASEMLKLKYDDFSPLYAYYTDDFKIRLWCMTMSFKPPIELLITNQVNHLYVSYCDIDWQKKNGIVEINKYLNTHNYNYNPTDEKSPPWEVTCHGDKIDKYHIQSWPLNHTKAINAFNAYKEHEKEVRRLENLYYYVEGKVSKAIYQAKVDVAYREYLDDHGAIDLWEDHLKNLNIKKDQHSAYVRSACKICSERYIDIVGKTLRELFEIAIPFGLIENKKRRGYHFSFDDEEKETLSNVQLMMKLEKECPELPMDFIIPPIPIKEELEDDDN